MLQSEIYKELQMTYEELQIYLIQKYGGAVSDYFATPECRSKSKKVSRTSEGLYCHHMDEDKGGNLSDASSARMQPFEWQKKERLVYCNVLEHLILHMKIAVLRQKELLLKPADVRRFFTTDGIYMICEEINDMFENNGTNVAWKKRCFEEIEENYEDYISLIKSLLAYIDEYYCGEKNNPHFLTVGATVHLMDCDCELLKVTERRDKMLLRMPTGEEKIFYLSSACKQLEYVDEIDIVTRGMASGYENFYESIYQDFIIKQDEMEIQNYVKALKVDYAPYEYAKYATIELAESFGASNAYKYISKALPMYSSKKINFEGKTPIFWSGEEKPKEPPKGFYIVRVETMFRIKEGNTPFVRYRESDLFRCPYKTTGTDYNYLERDKMCVLETSDIYDSKTKEYYSKYYDREGKLVDAKVILTLGREDYLLFREIYDIWYLKILDGCYFG